MINRYILLITLLYAFQLCAQNNHFRINGRVDTRYNDSLVTLFTFTGDIIRSADSTYVQNGHFDFTGPEYLSNLNRNRSYIPHWWTNIESFKILVVFFGNNFVC